MCEVSRTVEYVEGLGLKARAETLKEKCEEEYGLKFGDLELKKIERFIRWMRENGAQFRNFRMKYYAPDYRGIHTYEKIETGEVFLRVPFDMIITPQLGRETEIGKKIMATNVKINWDYLVFITIFLLIEMHNAESKWKPYLDVYPRLASSFPIFYGEKEKALLVGTPMLEHIGTEYKMLSEEYKRLVAAVPEFKQFTEEEYIRNKVLVVSRIFYVKIHDVAERIMVPLAGTLPS
eukprot:TRINITY_DN2248_c0_g2_i3.p1 TRINITY_DN2248_c0_g2~~TRINITY_DN2248_c0_g2_i3.p1  ORF type:complete len:235 (+),score=52.67 TRINITY_DN2248_c0_g2_i3:427-1131(+)